MSRFSIILLVASLTVAPALVVDRSSAEMRPDVTAKEMEKMQDTWAAQAYLFTSCARTGADFNCKQAPKAFAESCKKVAGNTITAATKENFVEYMNDICSYMTLGWQQATCQTQKTLLDAVISVSGYENRKSSEERAQKACHGLWLHEVAEQQAKVKEEKAKEDEDAKKESAQKEISDGEAKTAEEGEERAKAWQATHPLTLSFLQEGLSEAEARRQQEGVEEVARHEAQMDAELEPVSDELTHASSMSLFEKGSDTENDGRAVKTVTITGEEAQAKVVKNIAKREADQKSLEAWVASKNVEIASRNAMILRVRAAQKRRRDGFRSELNYDTPSYANDPM